MNKINEPQKFFFGSMNLTLEFSMSHPQKIVEEKMREKRRNKKNASSNGTYSNSNKKPATKIVVYSEGETRESVG